MALPHRETIYDRGPFSIAGKSSESESRVVTKAHWTQYLDIAIFGFLVLFAILLPHSIKGAERSWKIALLLWLLKIAIVRVRPYKQPLALPLLFYAVLSAISTILSPEPYLSWDRMKFVCLYLAGIVVAQNLRRLSQVRLLVILLVLSGFAAVLYTGWQYTYGVGVSIVELPPTSRLAALGVVQGDVITSLGGRSVHTPQQLLGVVNETPPSVKVTVQYISNLGYRDSVTASAKDFRDSGLGTEALKLGRGTPVRAQGTLGHYVVFAEMLTQIGCMTWALLLGTDRRRNAWSVAFALVFVGIAVALLATGTRAAVAGLVLACFLSVMLLAGRRMRVLAAVALVVIVAGATIWIRHSRGTNWVDPSDISTHFRVLMWEDGLRLVRQHPFFGVGMETVRVHFIEWDIRAFIQYNVMSHFHSTYLQIAVERGIPALIAWLWFCVAYAIFLWRLISRLRTRSRFGCAVAVGALAGLIAFCFTSFFHYNLGEESLAMMFFFYFGLAMAMDRMLITPRAINVL
jgi:O-antigen ligase/polysaccharide polymerase Wzy-like membrane protein